MSVQVGVLMFVKATLRDLKFLKVAFTDLGGAGLATRGLWGGGFGRGGGGGGRTTKRARPGGPGLGGRGRLHLGPSGGRRRRSGRRPSRWPGRRRSRFGRVWVGPRPGLR